MFHPSAVGVFVWVSASLFSSVCISLRYLMSHSPIAVLLARIVPINCTDCMAFFHFILNTFVLNSFHIEARITVSKQ